MSAFLGFMAVAAGAMLVPGPDTLVVLRAALAGGAAAGAWVAAGSGAGNLVWGSTSVLGTSGILAASDTGFTALKLAGATYVALLGLQALRKAARGGDSPGQWDHEQPLTPTAAFRRGFATDLLNVKVGLFWMALVPQFLRAGARPLLSAAMVVAMGSLAFAWLSLYAWLAAQMVGRLARPGFSRVLNGVAGLALCGIGVSLYAYR
ncbi:MAG: hypothetical protein QOD71_2460 [Thermoleophilaceae bacterium]|nr:hypothetical protein [Thermoleophilaceae bacterium]